MNAFFTLCINTLSINLGSIYSFLPTNKAIVVYDLITTSSALYNVREGDRKEKLCK